MPKPLKFVTIVCKFCSIEFSVKWGCRDRIFCSRRCQSKAILRTDSRKISKCIECNKQFKHYGERIVCSLKCNSRYLSKIRVGENNPSYNKNKETFQICLKCNKEFKFSRAGLHKNQKRYFCSQQCSFDSQRGQDRIEKDDKYYTKRYPSIFQHIKKEIKKRDNYSCVFCNEKEHSNSKRNHHVHHIDYDKKNNNIENLITLCQRCHAITNFQRPFWQTIFSALLSGSKIVKKGWGFEVHITNNSEYCLKYLVFFKNKRFSFHSHVEKKELWHCLMGEMKCILQKNNLPIEELIFKSGNKIEIDRNLIHQLIALQNSIIVEVSTPDYPEDSYRLLKGD